MAQLKQPPGDEPGPVDRSRIRELLEEAAEAHRRGEDLHRHPSMEALSELCGTLALYTFTFFPTDRPVTDADLDDIEDHLVRRADAWREQSQK